jgi:hypothetical protein
MVHSGRSAFLQKQNSKKKTVQKKSCGSGQFEMCKLVQIEKEKLK